MKTYIADFQEATTNDEFSMTDRILSRLDQLVCGLDAALRTLSPGSQQATRQNPALNEEDSTLGNSDQRHSAGLMRVNHTGEVCAQALYQGQATTARLPEVEKDMQQAAAEEIDHLAWCEQRLVELNARPSVLNPLWYGLSFGLGAAAGRIGDSVSLGFVAATEDQVCEHLEGHMQTLPRHDNKSRAIIKQMLVDEAQHAHKAREAGGKDLPRAVKLSMKLLSKCMTTSSYRL